MAALESAYASAIVAANRAHETATGSESVAENKYDTFGLEASYLAHGQSMRAAQCKADLEAFKHLFASITGFDMPDDIVSSGLANEVRSKLDCNKQRQVSLGRVVVLIDDDDKRQYLFVGPSAGGLKIEFDGLLVMIVTPASPLGAAMMNKPQGEEFSLTLGETKRYFEIVSVM
ncbi:GreA/GreB family elongation factor [Shewanella sp. 30m-9]